MLKRTSIELYKKETKENLKRKEEKGREESTKLKSTEASILVKVIVISKKSFIQWKKV